MSKTARLVFVGALALALVLVMAGSAFAAVAPHVTNGGAGNPSTGLSVSLTSTGNAGEAHGNWYWETSPVLPNPDGLTFGGWFNQNVKVSDIQMQDPDEDEDLVPFGAWYQHSANGASWDATQSFSATGSVIVSAEGLYSVGATGVDDPEDPEFTATETIKPAFGIDKTKPVSFSDVVPVYSGTATVTITATDTLSGVTNLQYSIDGGPTDYSWDSSAGVPFQVPVVVGPGTHTLSWKAFDNAGNIDAESVTFIVRPAGFVPSVSLYVSRIKTGKAKTHTEYHKAKFYGSVSPLASSAKLSLTVKKYSKKSKSYKSYKTYSLTVAKYAKTYSLTKSFASDGKYEVRASFGGKTTGWKKWTVN